MPAEYHLFDSPFKYKITVDGFELPKVKGRKNSDGTWSFLLDERFEITVSENDVQSWLWIVANAMAIGAGYSCFGENSNPLNPYARRMVGVIFDAAEQSVHLTDGGLGDFDGDGITAIGK